MTRLHRSLVLALAVSWCLALSAAGASAPDPARTSAGGPAGAMRAEARVDKLLVFVVENHSMDQMRDGMPWVHRLAERYGYATRYSAITHPSLPNYLAIAGGQTYGVTDDASPAAHPIHGPSVFGRAVSSGSTAALYAEGMDRRCRLTSSGRYAVKHNPWAYFADERQACRRYDVPLARLRADISAGALPAVGMVIPDLCNDAHDCSLAQANTWLRRQVARVLGGPDWQSGRLAVVITADEDDSRHGNRVLTVVAHPSLHHRVVTTPLSHYALSRSYAEVGGFAPLAQAQTARSLLRRFGLTAGG